METISIHSGDNGLKEVVDKALSVVGKGQKAIYVQEPVDLQSKEACDGADRKRFEFVNKIVEDGFSFTEYHCNVKL